MTKPMNRALPNPANNHAEPRYAGLRLRKPARYDLMVWLLMWGRSRRLRTRMLEPAKLRRGESVLDISCGTGSLALLAKEQVGSKGQVHGVDASEEMIAYADKKSKRAGLEVSFDVAPAQELPFEDASFDVVLNTLALHHLPKPSRYQAFGEMRRVLKPGGRALVVDFAEGKKQGHGLFRHLKHRHGSVPPEEIAAAVRESGFAMARSGPIGIMSLHFVLAEPSDGASRESSPLGPAETAAPAHASSRMAPMALILAGILLLVHVAAGASIAHVKAIGGMTWMVIAAIAAAAIGAKLALFRRLHGQR